MENTTASIENDIYIHIYMYIYIYISYIYIHHIYMIYIYSKEYTKYGKQQKTCNIQHARNGQHKMQRRIQIHTKQHAAHEIHNINK